MRLPRVTLWNGSPEIHTATTWLIAGQHKQTNQIHRQSFKWPDGGWSIEKNWSPKKETRQFLFWKTIENETYQRPEPTHNNLAHVMLRTCFRMRTHVRMHDQKWIRAPVNRGNTLFPDKSSYPRASPKCADAKENVQKIIFYGLWKCNNHHHHRNKKIFILSYRLMLPFFHGLSVWFSLRCVTFRSVECIYV